MGNMATRMLSDCRGLKPNGGLDDVISQQPNQKSAPGGLIDSLGKDLTA